VLSQRLCNLRARLADRGLLIAFVACAYLAVAVFGGIWLLVEYQAAGGAIPISLSGFLLVLFIFGPIMVLACGLLEAAAEGILRVIVSAAKRLLALVRST
jgi:1,4-dihydroxy-2-naphthoate octaprenyltransferase